MTYRLSGPCGLASIIIVCLFLPGTGLAQEPPVPIPIKPQPLPQPGAGTPPAPATDPPGLIRRPDWEAAGRGPACPTPAIPGRWEVGVVAGPPVFGPGSFCTGWPYGPREAPPWSYPGLVGGPYVGYPWGWPGYSGRAGQNWSNGLSLYGPPVPVYGPVPGVLGNDDLVRQWKYGPGVGMPFGWVGVYAASPRPKPLTVNVWPVIVESVPGAGCPGAGCKGAANPAAPGGCLVLSVKVPQPAAEVYVDGVKTVQTGTDRIFESPPLEAGKAFRYELVVRWVERGVTWEKKKVVTGTPGEVVRVDFTAPDVVVTGK
jgi:uncharacterized protein (TIGR03000 family)